MISLLTIQLHTASRKVMINYVGPVVIYKIIQLHNYLLMKITGKRLRGCFEHERLKPTNIRTNFIIFKDKTKYIIIYKENTHVYT